MDPELMTVTDWLILAVIVALCLLVVWLLAFRPKLAWKSTQRWRAPGQSEEELGEPTKGFIRASRIFALIVLVAVALCILGPFMPYLTSK